jgi:Rieske Fe-S protein
MKNQPKIRSVVRCTDREVGELTRLVVDPLSRDISHLVVKSGGREILIPTDSSITACTEDTVLLGFGSDQISRFMPYRKEDYVSVKEVEIPHLERHLDVVPGEVVVPIPPVEKSMERRVFLQRFANAIGLVLGLPLVYPVFKYIIHPMYRPFDNSWIGIGRADQLREPNVPQLIKFTKTVKEGYLEREYPKSHWAVKASPELLEKIYPKGEVEFHDPSGKTLWVNRKDDLDVVVFSGKCPHLGCAYRWRKHRRFGQVFICPCHLSVFEPSGILVDGPSPRPLDILPTRIGPGGKIEIIDMEFKAGKSHQVRIV